MRSWMVLLAGGLSLLLWSALVVWLTAEPTRSARTAESVTAPRAVSSGVVPLAALELRPVDGALLLSGELPNAAAAAELLSKARTMYAPLTVQDGLRVRESSASSAWLATALAALPLPMPGIDQPEWLLSAEGLRVGGVAVDEPARDALLAQLAQRFPDLPRVEQLRLSPRAAPTKAAVPAAAVAAPAADPPAGPVSTEAHPRQAEIDRLLAARPVAFASGSTRLRGDVGPDWKALVALIDAAGPVQVLVRGHTDSRGRAEANRRLSARRAEAVRQALIRAGLAAERIRVEGVGAEQPLVSNATAEGRRQNRRIEIRLLAEGGA